MNIGNASLEEVVISSLDVGFLYCTFSNNELKHLFVVTNKPSPYHISGELCYTFVAKLLYTEDKDYLSAVGHSVTFQSITRTILYSFLNTSFPTSKDTIILFLNTEMFYRLC